MNKGMGDDTAVRELIIVPGYFKCGSTLMYSYVWPKLGYSLLPKRWSFDKAGQDNLIGKIRNQLRRIYGQTAGSSVGSGRRVDFELCHTQQTVDYAEKLLKSIFTISGSSKVVAELGFLRPGVRDEIFTTIGKAAERLRAEGIKIRFLLLVRPQTELILSRIKHDLRTFPPYLNESQPSEISREFLESSFSENNEECRCIYPFCITTTVDGMNTDCVGDCGSFGKKIYSWELFDFQFQLERFRNAIGSDTDVYVQPLPWLISDPHGALNSLSEWLGDRTSTTSWRKVETLPRVNSAPAQQSGLALSDDARALIIERYQRSNRELIQELDLPDECLNF